MMEKTILTAGAIALFAAFVPTATGVVNRVIELWQNLNL